MELRAAGSAYVVGVGVVAAWGFTADSTPLILLAAALSLPASVLALPGYYVAYGLLALLPGASPSSSSGTASCTPHGACTSTSASEAAGWFLVTADLLGLLALTVAAILDVLLRLLLRRRAAWSAAGRPRRREGPRIHM